MLFFHKPMRQSSAAIPVTAVVATGSGRLSESLLMKTVEKCPAKFTIKPSVHAIIARRNGSPQNHVFSFAFL